MRRLPAALRDTVATADRSQIRLSLRTRDVRTARSITLQLDAALDRVISIVTAAQPPLTLAPSAIAAVLRQTVVEAHERQRADRGADVSRPRTKRAGAAITHDLLAAIQHHADAAEAALSAGIIAEIGDLALDAGLTERLRSAIRQVASANGPAVETAAAEDRAAAYRGRAGLITRDLRRNDLTLALACLEKLRASQALHPSAEDGPVAAREIMRALAEVAEEDARREGGVYRPHAQNTPITTIGAIERAEGPGAPTELARAPRCPATAPPSTTSLSPRPSASSLIEPHLVICGSGEKPKSSHTIGQDRRSLEMFVEVCGDRPLSDYSRRDVTHFLATLRKLPTNHGKSPKDKDLTVAELIARAESECALRISDKTVKRHWSALGQFLRYGADIGETTIGAKQDLLSEHGFVLGNPRDAREPWNADDLTALFASPVWRGCHPFFRTQSGQTIFRDAKFWLPLMALYHGNRLEEFADLRRKDIMEVDGIFGIRITNEHRRLKNNLAKRNIPIHPELIRMGFLKFVKALPADPDGALFPDLEPQGADKKRGPAFTKWFCEYRKEIGIYQDDVSYHSFRHLARTRIADHITTENQARILNYMFGWESGVTEGDRRYDKGPPLSQSLPVLSLIAYPELDLRHLYID